MPPRKASPATVPPLRHHTSVSEVARSRQSKGSWLARCSCGWTESDPRKTELDAWVDARHHITRVAGWDPIQDDTCEFCRQGGQVTYLDLRDRGLGLYWMHRDCIRSWREWGFDASRPAYTSDYFARVQAFHLRGEHEPTDWRWTARNANCPLCYDESKAGMGIPLDLDQGSTPKARRSGSRGAHVKRVDIPKHLAKARGFHEVAVAAMELKHYDAAMLNALYAAIGAANAVSVLVVSPGSAEPAGKRLRDYFEYEAMWSKSTTVTRSLLRLVVDTPPGLTGNASRADARYAIRGANDVIRWAADAIERDAGRAALTKRPLERPRGWVPPRVQSGSMPA
jgi:hypothetical protein